MDLAQFCCVLNFTNLVYIHVGGDVLLDHKGSVAVLAMLYQFGWNMFIQVPLMYYIGPDTHPPMSND